MAGITAQRGSSWAANAVGFLYWAGWQAVVPFLALYATSLGAGPATVGVILGGYHIFALLLSVPAGILAERWGSGRMMFIGCTLGALAPLLIIAGHSLGTLTAGLAVIGVAQVAVSIGTQVETIMASTPQTMMRAMGLYFFYSSLSLVVGPSLGGFLVHGQNYGATFLGAAVLSAMGMAAAFFPARRAPDRDAVVAAPPAMSTIVSAFRDKPTVRAALLVTLTSEMIMAFWSSFFPLLIISRGQGTEAIAFYFALRAVANTMVRPIIPLVSRRLTRARALIVAMVSVALSLAVMPLVVSRLGMGVAIVVFGFAGGFYATLLAGAVVAGFSPEAAGVATGTRMLMSRVGIMLGPITLGVLVESGGFTISFLVSAAIMAASALLYVPRPRPSALRASRKKMDPIGGADA
jgi:DHA1 family multidrug resistance protein-like MFS transporter